MAQHPNTQYVAHEFVRQYYTMLHKDPTQLHRFYTRESRLTHGVSPNAKSEDPVCGQEAIFEKISQLNFRNCYAKIRSVDSHPTIGGGVVIQVTGELSNGGMAMRKFMQTFVLAQQDVKRYNVYNDIFRYQDDTFEDTEVDETADGTVESENGYVNHDGAAVNHTDSAPDSENQTAPNDENIEAPLPTINDQFSQFNHVESSQAEEEVDVEEKDVDSVSENEIEAADEPEPFENSTETFEGGDYHHEGDGNDDVPIVENASETITDPVVVEDDGTEFKEYDNSDIKVEEPVEVIEESKPEPEVEEPKVFSWAALTKKNTPGAQTPAPVINKPAVKKVSPSQPPKSSPPKKREEPPVKNDSSDESRRRTGPAPDNHQIFIGNLPPGISEKDIREAFNEFGTIVEVRLNPKNFGFIAFTGPEAPLKILSKNKTIIIHNNTINTEVKRSVGSGGRGGGGGGGFRRGDRDSGGRGRNDMNKNANRNPGGGGGPNRPGKNSAFPQKQPRSGDEGGKFEKTRDQQKTQQQREPRQPRR